MPSAVESAIKNIEKKIVDLRNEAKIAFAKYTALSNKATAPDKQQHYMRLAIRVAENTETLVSDAKNRLAFLKSSTIRKKRL